MIIRQIQGLNLIFIGQFIQGKTLSCDTGIDFRGEIVIILNDFPSKLRVHRDFPALYDLP